MLVSQRPIQTKTVTFYTNFYETKGKLCVTFLENLFSSDFCIISTIYKRTVPLLFCFREHRQFWVFVLRNLSPPIIVLSYPSPLGLIPFQSSFRCVQRVTKNVLYNTVKLSDIRTVLRRRFVIR